MIVRTARDLGAAVRDARRHRGWSQADLANRVGSSRQWVNAFEQGKPTAEVGLALRVLAALGLAADVVDAPPTAGHVDLDDLLSGM